MALRMVMFLLVATSIYLGMHAYVGWRLGAIQWLHAWGRRALYGLLAFNCVLGLVTASTARIASADPRWDALQWMGFAGMGAFSMLFGLLALKDLAWLLVLGWDRISGGAADPARRRLLGDALSAGVAAGSAALSAAGLYQASRAAEVTRVDVPVPDLHPDLEGMTIAQISDIHVGPTIREGRVREIVASVNALGADLVAVTGDLVDGSVTGIGHHVAPLGELSAPLGVWFCTGNHEYYSGAPEWIDFVRSLGITVLIDAHEVIRRGAASVVVAGVPDRTAGRFVPEHRSDPEAAMRGAPDDAAFRLLLAHQPRSAYAALAAGFDLMLSGHTHGGQFFPYTILIHLAQPFAVGLHLLEGMWIYTNRGTTWWGPPVRLGAPQEITLLRLVKG